MNTQQQTTYQAVLFRLARHGLSSLRGGRALLAELFAIPLVMMMMMVVAMMMMMMMLVVMMIIMMTICTTMIMMITTIDDDKD